MTGQPHPQPRVAPQVAFVWRVLLRKESPQQAAADVGWPKIAGPRQAETMGLPLRPRGRPPRDIESRVEAALAGAEPAGDDSAYDRWLGDLARWARERASLAAQVLAVERGEASPATLPATSAVDGGRRPLRHVPNEPVDTHAADAFAAALVAAGDLAPDPDDVEPADSVVAWCRICDGPRDFVRPGDPSCQWCRQKPGWRHGPRAVFAGECGCERCAATAAQVWSMVHDRIEGRTMAAVGHRHGVTRERVRQLTDMAAPWRPWDAVRRTVKADLELAAELAAVRQCVTCGRTFDVRDRSGNAKNCSSACYALRTAARFYVDEDTHARHRELMASARRRAGTPEVNDGRSTKDRWMRVGSVAWAALVVAARGSWPLLDEVDDELIDTYVQPYTDLVAFDPATVYARFDGEDRALLEAVGETGEVTAAATQLDLSLPVVHGRLHRLLGVHERRLLVGGVHDTLEVAADVAAGRVTGDLANLSVEVLAAYHRSHPQPGVTDVTLLPPAAGEADEVRQDAP